MGKGLIRRPIAAAAVALATSLAWSAAQAAPIPLGDIQWDVTVPGSFGQFDIVNETGLNSSPPDFPVDTPVQFASLGLVVHFSDGTTESFGQSYFTLDPVSGSLDGSPIAIGGVSPQPTSAILTGQLTPTLIDVNGTPTTVDSSFDTATILPSMPPNLSDGDFAIINAEPASVTVPAPPIGFGLPVFLAVGGLWFGAKLVERTRRGAGLFGFASGMGRPLVPASDMTLTLLVGSFMNLILARRLRRGGAVGALFAIAAVLFPATSFADTTLHQITRPTQGRA